MGDRGSVDLVLRDRDAGTVLIATGNAPVPGAPLTASGILRLAEVDESFSTDLTVPPDLLEQVHLVQEGAGFLLLDADDQVLPYQLLDYSETFVLGEQYVQHAGVMEREGVLRDFLAVTDPLPLIIPVLLGFAALCLTIDLVQIRAAHRDARESRAQGVPARVRLRSSVGLEYEVRPDGTRVIRIKCGAEGEVLPMDSNQENRRRWYRFER